MREELAVRIDAANPDHHLWRNHGTWWVHYTVHLDGLQKRRMRSSLATHDVETARRLRNELFDRLRRGDYAGAARLRARPGVAATYSVPARPGRSRRSKKAGH